MSAKTTVYCPNCFAALLIDDSLYGKTGKCSKCEHRFVVQAALPPQELNLTSPLLPPVALNQNPNSALPPPARPATPPPPPPTPPPPALPPTYNAVVMPHEGQAQIDGIPEFSNNLSPQPRIRPSRNVGIAKPGPVREYRRTCRICGKVWHSLASRESQLKKQEADSNCAIAANCCNPHEAAMLQAKRNQQASQSEIARLKRCPECGSANYDEALV